MIVSKSNPCRILMYGGDAVLVSTRQALLERVGFCADAALAPGDTAESIGSEIQDFDLVIICHTIPSEYQQTILDAATKSGVKVYPLTAIVLPDEFLAQVAELARAC
jgi:hypothetical protein